MNLNYLKYFQTLANLEHYGRASEELGIAQSSLSHAIASLEQELGIPLFEKRDGTVLLPIRAANIFPMWILHFYFWKKDSE